MKEKLKQDNKFKSKKGLKKIIPTLKMTTIAFLIGGVSIFSAFNYSIENKINSVPNIEEKMENLKTLKNLRDIDNLKEYIQNYEYSDEMFKNDMNAYLNYGTTMLEEYKKFIENNGWKELELRNDNELLNKFNNENMDAIKYLLFEQKYLDGSKRNTYDNISEPLFLGILRSGENETVKFKIKDSQTLKNKVGFYNDYLLGMQRERMLENLYLALIESGNTNNVFVINQFIRSKNTNLDIGQIKNNPEFKEYYGKYNKSKISDPSSLIEAQFEKMKNNKEFQKETLKLVRIENEMMKAYESIFENQTFDIDEIRNQELLFKMKGEFNNLIQGDEEKIERWKELDLNERELLFLSSGLVGSLFKIYDESME